MIGSGRQCLLNRCREYRVSSGNFLVLRFFHQRHFCALLASLRGSTTTVDNNQKEGSGRRSGSQSPSKAEDILPYLTGWVILRRIILARWRDPSCHLEKTNIFRVISLIARTPAIARMLVRIVRRTIIVVFRCCSGFASVKVSVGAHESLTILSAANDL